MRWTFLLVFIGACAADALSAADYHVATGGDNANPGTSAQPWRTIAHAMSTSGGGDRILLNRGDTFREVFTISGNRELGAYGSGDAPVITASTTHTFTGTWASNASVRTVSIASPVLAVWIDGTFVPLARYPNADAAEPWLRVDDATTLNTITDTGLPGRTSGRWTGAQVRWRRWSWWWETRTITADSGGSTLDLNATPVTGMDSLVGNGGDNSPDGQGSSYFIDNDLDELDAPGEWFWGNGVLYVYPPNGSTATSVEVVTGTDGISSDGATIRDVTFARFGGTALSLNNGATVVEDCRFEEIEDTAISVVWNAGASVVQDCVLTDVRNIGILWNGNPGGATGGRITRNLLHRIGVQPGYGGSGVWHACGIIISNGRAVMVELNRIVDIGYAGILFGSEGQTANRNILVRTMSTLNDGAAIYTNCDASTITENIILDVVGDLSTSHPWFPLGHGIWPEFLSDFHDQVITDNTIVGCNGSGLYLANLYSSTMSRNVISDCRSSAINLSVYENTSGTNSYGVAESADDDLRPQGHALQDNILAVAVPTQRVARDEWLSRWQLPPNPAPLANLVHHYGSVDYGTMSQTTCVVPASGSNRFVRDTPDASWTSLADWSAANSSWAESSGSMREGRPHVLVNDTLASADMAIPSGTWTRADGTAVSGTITVPSFRSVLIVTSGSVPAQPWTVASGVNWRAATPTTVVLPGTDSGPGTDNPPGTGDGSPVSGNPGTGGGGGGCGAGGLGGMGLALALLLMSGTRLRSGRGLRPTDALPPRQA